MWKHLVLIISAMAVIGVARTEISKEDAQSASKPLLIPPENLKYFALGYNETLADSLWLRVIQDFEFCHSEAPEGIEPVSAEVPSPGEGKTRKARCTQGWAYHMLEAITELAPLFRQAYFSGAIMLSVIVDDISGATAIYNKGLPLFPTDWSFTYQAAYHFLYEENDYDKAAELLVQAGRNGAPAWVYALAAKLYSQVGRAVLAKSVLEDVLKKDPRAREIPRIKHRLEEVDKILREAQKNPNQ